MNIQVADEQVLTYSTTEMFEKVKNHLLAQNERATDGHGECMYRAPDGLRCAIGCLIPEEYYSEDLEGEPADHLLHGAFLKSGRFQLKVYKDDPEEEMSLEIIRFIQSLQLMHDDEPPHNWESQLNQIRRDFDHVFPDGDPE